MKISRRQAVSSAFVTAVALSSWGRLSTFALAEDDSIASINPRQTLFQPMEAATLSALDQFFPAYRTSPTLRALLHFTAILKNGGNTPVKAYGMRWIHNADKVDKTLFSTMFVSQPSTVGRSALGTGWNTIVYPGEYAVVTPLFLWSATKYRRHHGAIPVSKIMQEQSKAQSFIASASPSVKYRVRRDSKICRHTAIGYPSSMTSDYEATVNYETEVAARMIATAGVPEGLALAVSEWLPTIDSTQGDLASRVKYRYLLSVQARIQHRGPHVTWAAVQRIATRAPLALAQRQRNRVSSVSA
jgi:hypothetical protein